MSEVTYVPGKSGGWTLLVHGSSAVAVKVPASSELVARLWGGLRANNTPGKILDELTAKGISSAPEFVIVLSTGSSTTALVRGGATLVTGSTPSLTISGLGVSSWVEQVVDSSDGFEVDLGGSSGSVALPIESGVVVSSCLRWGMTAPAGGDDVIPEPAVAIDAPPIVAAPKPDRADIAPSQPMVIVPPLAAPPAPEAPPEPDAERVSEQTLASSTMTQPPAIEPPPESISDAGGYDHLFGETVFRSVEGAAVRVEDEVVASPPSVGPPPTSQDDGDHDGHTVMVSDLAALRRQRRAAQATSEPAPPIPDLFLELSTGTKEALDQPLVIGRAPSANRISGDRIPRLVSMNTPNQDISRTHAQVAVEGGSVVVTDLHSSNGTLVTMPGKPSQKLRPGEPTTVIVGTIIDLGDGATLTVCESK